MRAFLPFAMAAVLVLMAAGAVTAQPGAVTLNAVWAESEPDSQRP